MCWRRRAGGGGIRGGTEVQFKILSWCVTAETVAMEKRGHETASLSAQRQGFATSPIGPAAHQFRAVFITDF